VEASDSDRSSVDEALAAAGYDTLKGFLLAQTGASLTEMAKALEVPVQTFIRVHNDWVAANAPPILPFDQE